MPYDILLTIFDNIDLSDRLCLGLTCKRLAYLVTCSPRISFIDKLRARHHLTYHVVNDLYQPNQRQPLYLSLTPEWYTLIPRLAQGWVPKDKFKYCWKCNRILLRDPSYFEKALSNSKSYGWLWKLQLTETQWARMKAKEKRDHMVSRWLDGDPSPAMYQGLTPPPTVSKVYYPDLGIWADRKPDERGVECPLCLERELVYGNQRPKGLFGSNVSTRTLFVNLARLPVDFGVAAANTTGRWIRSPC
jgi:hypothetical protein